MNPMKNLYTWAVLVLLLSLTSFTSRADDRDRVLPQQDPPPQVTITSTEPSQVPFGQQGQLSIFGANFTQNTVVRLTGFGLLASQFLNSNTLLATIPANVPPGSYGIQVSDPERGSANAPGILTVLAPTATSAPPPTLAPTNFPTSTLPPPTPVPGEPTLVIRSFNASPQTVRVGGTVVLSLEIINQGNRTAQGVTLEVASGGSFVASSGQGTLLLPDIGPGGTAFTNLSVIASSSATNGPNTVTINFAYKDFEGKSYTRSSNLTINVERAVATSQVTVARYSVEPAVGQPGSPLTVRLVLSNSGNRDASQVIVRVNTSADSLLLPGPQGDSFPVGTLEAGEEIEIDLPMILNPSARPGPQLQTLALAFLQDDEPQTVNSGVTIEVGERRVSAPLFILDSYSTDPAALSPGDRFTLSLTVVNAGDTLAGDVLLLFGGVNQTPQPTPSGGNSGGSPTPTSSSPQLTGATFAPTGAGATRFVGDIAANGGRIEIEQEFIVSGSVQSGIYDLPVTLRYTTASGTTAQETLQANLVVRTRPRLRITLDESVIQPINVGEPSPVTVRVINIGRQDVSLTLARVSVDGGELLEGSESFVGPMRAGEERTIDATVLVQEEGTVELRFSVDYLDDFNQEQSIETEFALEAVIPEIPDDLFPPGELPGLDSLPPSEPERDWLARLVLALMGLGS